MLALLAPKPVLNVLASAAAVITQAVTGRTFAVRFEGLSNANTNLVFLTFNADTAQTGYSPRYVAFNSAATMPFSNANDNSMILYANASTNGHLSANLHISRIYDPTANNTIITVYLDGYQLNQGIILGGVQKIYSGDIPLSSISIRSNQTNGLKAGSYMSVQTIA